MFKQEEIQAHFDNFLAENKDYLIENYPNSWLDELHDMAFNQDYYIIGTEKARKWLGAEAFNIIDIIKSYEDNNFGQVLTDFSNPEQIVNMYTYIVGEEIVAKYIDSMLEVA